MSALTPTTDEPPVTVAPDVPAFAQAHGVAGPLDALLEATRRVYPTARDIKVFLERDAEIRDWWWIVFETSVPLADIPDYVTARRRWSDELFRVCPAPLARWFCLTLLRVTP